MVGVAVVPKGVGGPITSTRSERIQPSVPSGRWTLYHENEGFDASGAVSTMTSGVPYETVVTTSELVLGSARTILVSPLPPTDAINCEASAVAVRSSVAVGDGVIVAV